MSIIITKIERQKKNKQRYSLYSKEKFIVGISEESLLEFNIRSGLELSEDLLDKIEKKEKVVAIREQAWRFLARRMHSEKELKLKLVNKGYEQENIDHIITELRSKKYLNEDDKLLSQLEIKVREKLGLIESKESKIEEKPKEAVKEQKES